MNNAPVLCVRTVHFVPEDRDCAYELGRALFGRLTRPWDDALSHGPGIPVDVAVSAEQVDTVDGRNRSRDVVIIPALGASAFSYGRDHVIERLNAWHAAFGEGRVLPIFTAEAWRAVEPVLTGKPLLTELYGENRRRRTLDELVLGIARVLEPETTKKVQLFVSHAKRDLHATNDAAKQIHRYATTETTAAAFFDAQDLAPGFGLAEQIDAAVGTGVFVAVRSDSYHSRAWCQRELLNAKRAGLPTLTVELLTSGEQRSSPYGGNSPTVVWSDNPEDVVARAMVEWVSTAHFRLEGARVADAAGLPASRTIMPRPPELLDFAQGPLSPISSTVVLHPDPELSPYERDILTMAHPRLRLATPTTVFRQVLGRVASDGGAPVKGPGRRGLPAAPLQGTQIAWSISDSPNTDGPRGFTPEHIRDVVVYLARTLISSALCANVTETFSPSIN